MGKREKGGHCVGLVIGSGKYDTDGEKKEKKKKGGSGILLANVFPGSVLKQACRNPNRGHSCALYM